MISAIGLGLIILGTVLMFTFSYLDEASDAPEWVVVFTGAIGFLSFVGGAILILISIMILAWRYLP